MSRSPLFTMLAEKAGAEEIAARIADTIDHVPGSAKFFTDAFAALMEARGTDTTLSMATAQLYLKETKEAASGERMPGLRLRRFLMLPEVRRMVEAMHPAYETVMSAKNAAAVRDAVREGPGDIDNVPPRAVFRKRPKPCTAPQ